MDKAFIKWLNAELIRRNLSARKLSAKIGKSSNYVSHVLSGRTEPALSFYVGLAEEWGIPVENIIRLAVGSPPDEDDTPLTAKEIWRITNLLSPEERQEVLDFVDYLMHKRRDNSANDEARGDVATDIA